MNRRNLVVALAVAISSVLMMAGSASVASASTVADPTCVVKTLPSFVAQGEAEVAATTANIVEIGCDPTVYGTGSEITIEDFQLYLRCGRTVTWYEPNPFRESEGKSIAVKLDADGNAMVALLAGPGCQAGETLVTAHMNEEPFETFSAAYSVLPPVTTPPGITALEPGGSPSQVEDSNSSGV